ncbi:lipid IV(A) 3-deoxy-D-manno-octulosonic acid transferase [Herbaspirillum sp. RTI4]|uniref:lipid IV(A) 3-deoxy-D-manno-octulosonic acid transferase n=1 Tax=Herbaspirillum sp. RTI4 TaxID=3048640 RepID=UPI002AB32E37|nr:lipid IV(A) 3-deoxy-D-manno-octulosonic acid transferase [Herbaspirillum sp. RTI4]MDY7577633.1 lipid IV(A) 3-deoxy-D-manno-octulosonic acid transferase [Herbaspirillum sp. RTI4]MEA9982201.1 lipid IV(A) 3-deoxy-D-manno-octulosonic acid transferase [Herbaspirillum sp. RTI4]
MRLLYSFLWWLILPLALLRLWRRGRHEAGYRQHIGERLGFYGNAPLPPAPPVLWVHAVSVGETRAAEPLIVALLEAYPKHSLLLTHMTITGRATGQQLFGQSSQYGSRVSQAYLPYDTGWMAGRFLDHFKPAICILMETEVWPNMIAQCGRRQVPVVLANARLSERSLARGKRFHSLFGAAAAHIAVVAAQTEADADRLRQFGAGNVQVTGSLKFDVALPADMVSRGEQWRAQFGSRPVLLCASTREGEEELILDVLAQQTDVDWLTIIVPRHPQRFDRVAELVAARGLPMQRRSALDDQMLAPEVKVLLGDSMGEMFAWYAACDLAFIGGSLLPLGGQNLIEAFMLGKPVLIGPHTFNFAAVSEEAIAAGAAARVGDAAQMLAQAELLLHDAGKRQEMGRHAQDFALHHRGATERTMHLLEALLLPVC